MNPNVRPSASRRSLAMKVAVPIVLVIFVILGATTAYDLFESRRRAIEELDASARSVSETIRAALGTSMMKNDLDSVGSILADCAKVEGIVRVFITDN